MPATGNRAHGRNVHFYDASKPELKDAKRVPLGGLIQNGSVTEANFLEMLDILLDTESPFRVYRQDDHGASSKTISRSSNPLLPGEYEIYCDSPIEMNESDPDPFIDGIRARDGRCVMSGVVNRRAPSGTWSGFDAAHIFPAEQVNIWNTLITNLALGTATTIDSCQNGFLLQKNIRADFDNYFVTVNPDDKYKIIVFSLDLFGVDGRTLDPVCRDPADPHRVSDNLLRWHYRQTVLANMRGEGEPVFDEVIEAQ